MCLAWNWGLHLSGAGLGRHDYAGVCEEDVEVGAFAQKLFRTCTYAGERGHV